VGLAVTNEVPNVLKNRAEVDHKLACEVPHLRVKSQSRQKFDRLKRNSGKKRKKASKPALPVGRDVFWLVQESDV